MTAGSGPRSAAVVAPSIMNAPASSRFLWSGEKVRSVRSKVALAGIDVALRSGHQLAERAQLRQREGRHGNVMSSAAVDAIHFAPLI